jgi:hypothetical protein
LIFENAQRHQVHCIIGIIFRHKVTDSGLDLVAVILAGVSIVDLTLTELDHALKTPKSSAPTPARLIAPLGGSCPAGTEVAFCIGSRVDLPRCHTRERLGRARPLPVRMVVPM